MKLNRILIFGSLLFALSFFGCQASMQKNKPAQRLIEQHLLIFPTDGSEPKDAIMTFYDSKDSETVQQDPCDDIYGPLVALGPYLVDNCPLPPRNHK